MNYSQKLINQITKDKRAIAIDYFVMVLNQHKHIHTFKNKESFFKKLNEITNYDSKWFNDVLSHLVGKGSATYRTYTFTFIDKDLKEENHND